MSSQQQTNRTPSAEEWARIDKEAQPAAVRGPTEPQRREGTTGGATLVRVVGLPILIAFLFLASGAGPDAARLAFPFLLLACTVAYFLPTIEAYLRQHRSLTSIGLVNLFLGWTLLGWVAAIAWACAGTSKQQAAAAPATSLQPFAASPASGAAVATSVADELAKLVALMHQGVLTEEEFYAQKAKVLGR